MTTPLIPIAHNVAHRALTYLHDHQGADIFPDDIPVEPDDPDTVYKPVSEIGMAAALVLREGVGGTAQLRAARELIDSTWRQLREGDLLYERQLRNCLLTDPIEVYCHFTCGGHRHQALERLAAHNAAVRSTPEVYPNRRLAVANAYRTCGMSTDDDWGALLRATWLGATPPPWAIDWDTAYSVTHTVFHVTDWGARPDDLPPDIVDYLATWLPVWTDVWAEVGDWDLVAELLIVDACLPEPRFDLDVWTRFAAVQHDDGLVPRDGEPVDDDRVRRFWDHHHATVVAVVAGTLAVSRLLGAGRCR
ncbi:DUF6895 family protein [Saccharothrix sp. Mg75]|uniref:DUF6895 family protein n=1 Tax=Saccharothrix sp. Mg75 TaxID=3445357 RepID=UPI003EEFB50F